MAQMQITMRGVRGGAVEWEYTVPAAVSQGCTLSASQSEPTPLLVHRCSPCGAVVKKKGQLCQRCQRARTRRP